MKKLHIVYSQLMICLFVFSHSSIHAQYYGGDGDGSIKNSILQITLNGNQVNPVGLYRGGHGEGHDKKSIIASLSGDNISYLYVGGFDDGHTKDDFNGTLGGEDLTTLYLGGIGDGHNKDNFQGVMDGAMTSVLYNGGISDGHSKFSFTGVIDGAELAQLYQGGVGEGSYKLSIATVLSGELLSQLYLGGIDDGTDKATFSGVLDGSSLAGLYSGGMGDGFSKHTIQYIFDFPGCTFVVNTDDDGFGSLRYAIDCASPGDTIDFSPLLQQESIVLTSGKIDITKDLYINGIKTAQLTVDANQVERAFKTDSNTITIKGLKIIVGMDPLGGAIKNNGIMTLMDVDIYDPTNNSTTVISSTITGTLTIQGEVRILEN